MTKIIDCKPNEIIAVDSDVLVDYDQLNTFLTNFGFKKAKFILNLPKSWVRDVSNNILEEVKTKSNGDAFALSSYIDALNSIFNSTYAKCELLYELTNEDLQMVERASPFRSSHINIALEKKLVNLVVSNKSNINHVLFDDIRMRKVAFKETEQKQIREVTSTLDEPDSIVNQQVQLFERIIDFNDEFSLMDRYLNITLNSKSQIDFSTDYGKFLDKLIKKIGFYATTRGSNKVLNIYLDRQHDKQILKNKKKSENHTLLNLKIIADEMHRKYKSLFANGLIIKIYPFEPISQDTHDRWFIGHTAGGWGCLRGAKDTFQDELNFFTTTKDSALGMLSDYDIKNKRIKLDFGLEGPIVISKDSH